MPQTGPSAADVGDGFVTPLTRREAQERAEVVRPTEYEVHLDFTQGDTEFESYTRVRFDATPGASTFVDLAPVAVHSMTLNGSALPANAFSDRRIALQNLAAKNELVVTSRMRYSHDGQGLHRAIDPADGEAYIYGHLFMDVAPRVFACFDQPDLKAPYRFSVTAPREWSVLTNAPMTQAAPGQWHGVQDKPLATYFVTVCAGPYASVFDEHDGIPLGIHARRSLEPELREQAADILDVTKRSFDYYHSLFGIRYPFGEYHQVFVPEFNAGAMENPGCVTFRDQMIFTGVASHAERMNRANTIAHEMAHMWFGDIVTMRWWDDLWLNESFAEYMANRTLTVTGLYPDAEVAVAAGRRSWGYAAERSPSTHSIAGAPAANTDEALQNFDGIAYAKGSAALRQLILTIGDEAFVAGVRDYLHAHTFANAELPEFLASLSAASDRDLTAWARAWLMTAGMDSFQVVRDGQPARLVITPDPRFEAQRQHVIRVDALSEAGDVVASDELHDAIGTVPLPHVAAALDSGEAVIAVPNAADLSWGGVIFADDDLEPLARVLPYLADATTRAMVWTALAHGLAKATVSPQALVTFAEATLPHEEAMSILDVGSNLLRTHVIGRFLPHSQRPGATARMATVGEQLLAASASTQQLAGARLIADAGAAERLRPWFDGVGVPEALAGDAPFRWRVAVRLASLGAVDVGELDAVLDADVTLSGQLSYLEARASLPTAENKAWAWQELTAAPTPQSPAHSNYEMNALATGFFRGGSEQVLAPYIERYVADIPAMRAWVGEDALARVAVLAFPRQLSSEPLEIEARRMLDAALPASVERAVTDEHARVVEVLDSRVAFGY